MPQPVADGENGHTARPFVHGQLVNAALQTLPHKGNGIIRLDFLDENVPHLVVGAVVLDLVDQLVFDRDLLIYMGAGWMQDKASPLGEKLSSIGSSEPMDD